LAGSELKRLAANPDRSVAVTERVGWIGLGVMGRPLAMCIARAGFPLTVYDIRAEPVSELVGCGAAAAESVAATAAACDVLFASLPNASASEAVAQEIFSAPSRPKVYVELSTLSPSFVRRLADRAEKAGIAFLEAPVSGTAESRIDGRVTVIAGGDEAIFRSVRPMLDAFGRRVHLVGPVGAGSVAKICNNLIVHTSLVAIAESLSLGSRHGLDLEVLKDAIMSSSGGLPMVPVVAEELGKTDPAASKPARGALRLVLKDLELAAELASEVDLPARCLNGALEEWRGARAAGLEDASFLAVADYIAGSHVPGARAREGERSHGR
jgi:2-hydroxy-3-oxopropionate reductase